ncbi:sensor histidine kinase [Aureimonas leprariae]|uniref:Blue-light-activated histidine kinase n=1 Tax=Plantimonas leprariae TaxID=2615207 RepID=A0A7V7TY86_9HYPH|nr:PAS domain S-box protein [Aureimonas leprariae]KAB0682056.1 PAS domain S-box protein [Aureimonas leprariae]
MNTSRVDLVDRQKVLADFGELVLRSDNLQEILDEACRLVAEALGTDLAKILEIEPGRGTALVRAGHGWSDGIVGRMRITMSERSSESFALEAGIPVVTVDTASEERFEVPAFMRDHGVVALVNVPIFLPGRRPFGLLQVDAREPRHFGEEDIQFLRTYCMVLGPVIDRLRTVGELADVDERFRLVVEHAHEHAIVLSDPENVITAWFPGAAAVFGWTEAEMVGQPLATIFTPEDRSNDVPEREMARASESGATPNIRWHAAKGGKRVFLDGQTVALRQADGSVRGFMKIAQDITERHRAEERKAVLQDELQHRVRNVLAMIAAIVRRSDVSGTAEDLRMDLAGRIAAMSRTQVLLTRAEGMGVNLEVIVRDELLAQSPGEHAVSMDGPAVPLAPKAAEVVTLAIHELATNAAKYGALAQPGGRIDVAWWLAPSDGQDWVELEWRESGVTVPSTPGRREGFGTELITRRVPYELKGRGEVDLRPDGLVCRISFPLVHAESVLQTDLPVAGRRETLT